MTNILNPYIAGAPVVETSMFFGREDIFGWIERSLTGKFVNHILVLHGQRRVGKTSVLKQIPRHLPKQYIQVFFDLQGRTNTTMDRFLWWMASEITRTLKKEYGLDLPKIERNAFADPEAFINDFLPSLQKPLQDKILLFTFDEFDTLDRSDIQESLARPLIAYLRRLMEIEGLNFIFSIGSSGNKLENMQASYTDFFKTALYRKVSFLTKDDCERLITKPVEETITYEPTAVEKISHYTSGHPYFTQLMCHELFSRCQKTGSRTITSGDVDSILNDVIERGTVNLKFVWDEASDLEKWILAALAQEERATLWRVHKILKEQGLRSNEADLNSAILHLRDKDVLDTENGFVIQLMKLWLQTNRPMDRVREELVQTNPIADRYLEIGDEYRERGEYQQAIQSYEQALAVQENSVRALQNIATIYALQNSHEEAVKYFARILLIDEENIPAKQGFIQAQMLMAKKAIKDGLESEAEKAIRSILMIAPAHVEATKLFSEMYVKKAESLLHNGLENQAMEKFQQAMEISPDDEAIRKRYEKIITDKKAALVQGWLEKAEKSLVRQRWDEAAGFVEEAINIDPENPDLRKRLLQIKDAPRQEKIKAYKQETEQGIAKGNYPKAISAIQTAILLAPEDRSLKEWLASIQGDQVNAQLRLYQSQADQAEAEGNWDVAITAREAALKQNPEDKELSDQLQKTQAARHQAQLSEIRTKIDNAKKAQNWADAIQSTQVLLQLSPDDQQARKELGLFQIEQRNEKIRSLKLNAEAASKAEKWDEVIQYWQDYVSEKPEERERVSVLIEQATQKAALLKDYETAQVHIRKRQYSKAIHLLQGIIAKDPTYKASSRLLVEAVEANKERKPFWKNPLIYAAIGLVIVAVVVIILLPQIKTWINSKEEPAGIVEENVIPTISPSPIPEGKIITVNNANDTGTASFRYAILNAQEHDTIVFNPNIFSPDNPTTIFLNSQLPRISQGHIKIDASNAGVILDGSNIPEEQFCLVISSDNNVIMGLQIFNCQYIAIYIEGFSFNTIGGDPNIGESPVGQGNLISNNGTGIQILSMSQGNKITGNIIGTDPTQTEIWGNNVAGIFIEDNGIYGGVVNRIGPHNVIAYNGFGFYDPNISGGIVIYPGNMPNIITGNSIYDNYLRGINYPQNDMALDPPSIIFHDIELGIASGQTCAGCNVEIFSTDRDEGRTFEGSIQADEFGIYYLDKRSPFSAPTLTATATFERNTSEFSYPVTQNSAILAAIDAIQNSPTYETSFDVWEFGDPNENVLIENGKLITNSDGDTFGQLLSQQASGKFAAQFEFEILDPGDGGACKLAMANEEMGNDFNIGFTADGFSYTETNIQDINIHLAEGFYDYHNEQPNEVLLIIVDGQVSVFINNQLIYSFLDPQENLEYNRQALVADAYSTCEFDNYKIWNLEGLAYDRQEDPLINSINTYIHNTPASPEIYFSQIDSNWLIGTNDGFFSPENYIVDGSLVVNNSNSNLNDQNITFPQDWFGAMNSVIAFSLDASDFSIPAEFGVRIRDYGQTSNPIKIVFDPQLNQMIINSGNPELSEISRNIDLSTPHRFLIITYEQYLAVWVDGKTISLSYIGEQQDGHNSHFFVEQKDSNEAIEGDYQIKFDDIRFWDLDEVAFDVGSDSETYDVDQAVMEDQMERLITLFNETPLTFVDDFSTIYSEWGEIQKNDETYSFSNHLDDERINLNVSAGERVNYNFPVNGFLNAEEFIVSCDFEFVQKSFQPNNDVFGFKFLKTEGVDSEYDLRLTADGIWEIVANNVGGNQYSILDSGTYTATGTIQLMLSVYDKNNILLRINNVPEAFIPGIATNEISNYFYFDGGVGAEINFDNVQFWNLDGVEISNGGIEYQVNQSNESSTWETDFVNPSMEYIQNRSPDIEDTFDTPSSAWVLTADYLSNWDISFQDGKMIVIGEAKNTLLTFFDFVAEVEMTRVLGTGWQGIGWNNGAEISCSFMVIDNHGVGIWCNNEEIIYTELSGGFSQLEYRVIVKGGQMAFYLNDEFLGHYENDQYRLYRNYPPMINVGTWPETPPATQDTAGVDNFRVWNISDLELP